MSVVWVGWVRDRSLPLPAIGRTAERPERLSTASQSGSPCAPREMLEVASADYDGAAMGSETLPADGRGDRDSARVADGEGRRALAPPSAGAVERPWRKESVRHLGDDATELDDRRSGRSAHREHHGEIGVGGDHRVVMLDRPVEYRLVRGRDQPDIADVDRLGSDGAQRDRDSRRQVCVDQQLHAGRATGTSRSLTRAAPYSSAAVTSSGSR